MAFTYSGDPATSLKDRARFELGDTNRTAPLLTDEEIKFLLDESPSFEAALAGLAQNVATRFRRQVNTRVGQLTLDYKSRADQWQQVADHWVAQARGKSSAIPSAGGVTSSPYFFNGMHDNPGADVSGKPIARPHEAR